jgi:hypothetical protein
MNSRQNWRRIHPTGLRGWWYVDEDGHAGEDQQYDPRPSDKPVQLMIQTHQHQGGNHLCEHDGAEDDRGRR